jgi:hypothetical protein
MARLNRLEQDEVLTVRTYKIIPNAQLAWANTYEVICDQEAPTPAQAEQRLFQLIDALTTLEKSLLSAAFVLDRIVVSTYVADSRPYDPFTFASYTISQAGTYSTASNPPLALQFCTLVKRLTPFGRQGNILYRGIVGSADATITPSGTSIRQARITAIETKLNDFLTAIRNFGFDLVMARGVQSVEVGTLRRVRALEVKQDMRFKKLNNRWFDKARQSS